MLHIPTDFLFFQATKTYFGRRTEAALSLLSRKANSRKYLMGASGQGSQHFYGFFVVAGFAKYFILMPDNRIGRYKQFTGIYQGTTGFGLGTGKKQRNFLAPKIRRIVFVAFGRCSELKGQTQPG
jgi:hypothetical protein